MTKAFLLFFFFSCAVHARNTPVDSDETSLISQNRFFYKIEDVNLMGEYSLSSHQERDTERRVLVGGKYRLHENFKLGLYYARQWGVRHDEDWIKDGTWQWRSTDERGEDLTIVELTARTMLGFVPGTWVGEARIRWFHNFDFQKDFLRLRLGPTWLISNDKGVNWVVSLKHELYHPLNYGNKSIYGQWTYLTALYRPARSVLFGPLVAYGREWWSGVVGPQRTAWEASEEGLALGLVVNFYAGN